MALGGYRSCGMGDLVRVGNAQGFEEVQGSQLNITLFIPKT